MSDPQPDGRQLPPRGTYVSKHSWSWRTGTWSRHVTYSTKCGHGAGGFEQVLFTLWGWLHRRSELKGLARKKSCGGKLPPPSPWGEGCGNPIPMPACRPPKKSSTDADLVAAVNRVAVALESQNPSPRPPTMEEVERKLNLDLQILSQLRKEDSA